MADANTTPQPAKAAPRAKASARGRAQASSSAKPSGTAQPSGPVSAKASAAGLSLARQRELAKVGMTVSLAVLVATAFTGTRKRSASRALHLASGAALVGFSLWHYGLYGKPAAKTRENDL